MKVLLINPPSNAPNPVMPLGLAYIAAVLEQNNITVEIIDAWVERYSYEDLGKEIAGRNCDIIGITIMSPLYSSGMKTVDIARENSKAVIVVGGPHPSALPEECLADNKNIDYVVVGEGEKAFTELARSLNDQGKGLDLIKGLVFKGDGRIINNGTAEKIEDLDTLPFPARHLLPIKKYKTHPPYGKKNPYITMITSRGCPFSCTYCSKTVFGDVYRSASPQRVLEEIIYLKEKYKVKEIHFYDDDFTMNKQRAAKICNLLVENKIKILWSCTTRVDLVDESLLNIMKKSGCWLISYGVESADKRILKEVKKGYTIEDIQKAFFLTKQIGIRTVGFFMLGLPGETKETLQKTVDFALELDPDFVSWGITILYPGSSLYNSTCGEMREDINKQYKNYQSQSKSWQAYVSPFADGASIVYEGNFDREYLKSWAEKANRIFYLRPLYLIKSLLKIRSGYEFIHYCRGGLDVIKYVFNFRRKRQ